MQYYRYSLSLESSPLRRFPKENVHYLPTIARAVSLRPGWQLCSSNFGSSLSRILLYLEI
ncbi:hypothetical protein BGZ60DRAFT_400478 [Tricladium varicosporioides]|nr:hypothetical protein BGZ60DRAFT_400478 [Hymenoscyphus varicosporioides]